MFYVFYYDFLFSFVDNLWFRVLVMVLVEIDRMFNWVNWGEFNNGIIYIGYKVKGKLKGMLKYF